MAAPFFQGNIEDLLRVAGQGQGSYMLGQMLDRQRRAEEADISTSVLNQEAKRAEMQRAGQLHPLNMQKIKAEIDKQIADKYHTEAQTTGLKFKNESDIAAGGPEAAGKAIQTQRAGVEFEQSEKKRKAYEDEIAGMEWSPNLKDRLHSLHNKYQVDPNEAAFNYGQITSKESWDAYRQALYNASAKAREQAQKDAAAFERTKYGADAATERTIEAAKIKAAKDALGKEARNLEEYAVRQRIKAKTLRDQAAGTTNIEQRTKLLKEAEAAEQEANNALVSKQRLMESARAQGFDMSEYGLTTKPPPDVTMPPVGQGATKEDPLSKLPPGSKDNGDGTYTLPDGRRVRPKQ